MSCRTVEPVPMKPCVGVLVCVLKVIHFDKKCLFKLGKLFVFIVKTSNNTHEVFSQSRTSRFDAFQKGRN